jgi:hypothetical protein
LIRARQPREVGKENEIILRGGTAIEALFAAENDSKMVSPAMRQRMQRLPIQQDLAGSRRKVAAQHLHRCCFARAVRPQQRQNAAGGKRERKILHGNKGLCFRAELSPQVTYFQFVQSNSLLKHRTKPKTSNRTARHFCSRAPTVFCKSSL